MLLIFIFFAATAWAGIISSDFFILPKKHFIYIVKDTIKIIMRIAFFYT